MNSIVRFQESRSIDSSARKGVAGWDDAEKALEPD